MKITVVGCGLGFSLCHLLSSQNHEVIGLDINPKVFSNPRIDTGMQQLIKNQESPNLRFTTDYTRISDSDLIFIFVGTPLIKNRLSTKHVENTIDSCLKNDKTNTKYALLSTMPIGGCTHIFNKYPELKNRLNYAPPMIRQGFFHETFTDPPPGWQLISDNADYSRILQVYKPILKSSTKYFFEDPRIVEMAKLVINAFLTNKIVFANALDHWCAKIGLDAHKVMKIVGSDRRIGTKYITPGEAVGGRCLPRDILELMSASFPDTHFAKLLYTLHELNEARKIT